MRFKVLQTYYVPMSCSSASWFILQYILKHTCFVGKVYILGGLFELDLISDLEYRPQLHFFLFKGFGNCLAKKWG